MNNSPPWFTITDFSQKPIFVCWEMTKSCLLKCRHCRAKAITQSLPGELSCEDGIALIDQVLDFGKPHPALLLTGGDPLMRPDLQHLVTYAKDHGVYIALAASVTPNLDRDMIARLKKLGVDIMSISLDGALPSTHDRIRGITGTWHKTIETLRIAKELGLRTQVNTTVMKSNLKELADIFHLAKMNGAVAWEVFFLIRTGRGASLENPQAWESEEVAHFLFDTTHYGIPVRTAEGPHFRRVYNQRQNHASPPDGELYRELLARLHALEGKPGSPPSLRLTPTGDGRGIIFVAYNGEVNPSGFLPISLGKLPRDNLGRIYRSHPLLLALRNPSKLKGRCGRCEYRMLCGGSRARAFAEFHDPLEEDPACIYSPQVVHETTIMEKRNWVDIL